MSHVYFLRPIGQEGPVKIGHSKEPLSRLAIYSSWSPAPLEVVATLPGSLQLEARFHARFRAQHSHHEWFAASPELTAVIEAIRDGSFDVESLPAPKRISSRTCFKWSESQKLKSKMHHGLRKLERRGVTIPDEIEYAKYRYGAGRHFRDYNPEDPADAALVFGFIAAQTAKLEAA